MHSRKKGVINSLYHTVIRFMIMIVYTFNEVADERAQVVGLLLLALAHLHHVGQILTDLLQHLATHLHLALEEAEQWILVLCSDQLEHFTATHALVTTHLLMFPLKLHHV